LQAAAIVEGEEETCGEVVLRSGSPDPTLDVCRLDYFSAQIDGGVVTGKVAVDAVGGGGEEGDGAGADVDAGGGAGGAGRREWRISGR